MKPAHVISLGAGVDSTCMALMAAHGEITPMPDAAIFADTGAERRGTYENLAWLKSENVLPFPIIEANHGDLRQELLDAAAGIAAAWGRPPLYVRNPDGSIGRIRRQCTQDYKIDPALKALRAFLGIKPRARPRGVRAVQWIGITVNEAARMNVAPFPWIENRYPLVDLRMSRHDCIRWLERHEYPVPVKSACTFCPYRKSSEWRRMRDEDPEAWEDAVNIDRAIRDGISGVKSGRLFVHRSGVPLEEVDLSTAEDRGQLNMFNEECTGGCGL